MARTAPVLVKFLFAPTLGGFEEPIVLLNHATALLGRIEIRRGLPCSDQGALL
jgi:hypothetical protein